MGTMSEFIQTPALQTLAVGSMIRGHRYASLDAE